MAFSKEFSTPEACYKYLAACKWPTKNYRCKKCNHHNYCQGKKPHSRRCTRCKYDESPTVGTLFHQLKFPIEKAFYIIYLVVTGKKGISSHELGRRLSLRQGTCYKFKRKIVKAMEEKQDPLLTGQVEVDEFYVGGPEQGKPGRSKGKKRVVVLAIRTNGSGIFQAASQKINGVGTKELRPFFEHHISPRATVKTDQWRGYSPLKATYPLLEQYPSNKGSSFPLMHRYIMMFKGWLRGIHHSVKDLSLYLHEYNYRFNMRKKQNVIFHDIIDQMMQMRPIFNNQLKWAA